MSAIIKIENLSFAYPAEEGQQPHKALDNVNLEIEEGSFVAILGHNGSGKSTLAKMLSLVLMPDSGSVWLDGKNMSAEDITEEDILQARREVGMVFQNPDNQIVATVVEEDVAFGPENLGLPSEEIRRRVDEALAMVGMTKYARHAPHKLSGGQKQRIAIAGIIAMRRRCIIFDESTAMLDPVGRKEVMATIERLNREEGITVLHITHYMSEAVRADRVVVMDQGSIIMDGTPKEVFSQPEKLWEVRLDVPQTTELLYHMKKNGLDVRLDIFDPDECAAEIASALASL
ncbi:MAG: energy-coupling factor transporter ATPase [Ruminococcaceae bacterium]|nr:energy-coupling factor transporter ATPase [Oscillospiraceae bacterium]